MKIAFFCGAGAESEFDICSGNEFAKNVLGIEKGLTQNCINKLIQNHYAKILENCKKSSEHPNWYPATCYAPPFNINTLLKNSIKKEWLSNNKYAMSITSFEKEVNKEAKKIKNIGEKRHKIYATPNYMGILDENFHTIIAPRSLGPQKFWTVIMAITRAYLAICAGLLNIPLKGNSKDLTEKLKLILENPHTTYENVISSINDTNSKFQKESYYSIVRDTFREAKEKINIISTNYTPVAELIIGSEIQRIAYIHGHIKLFESPYYLQVTDISEHYNSEKFSHEINFPYMFVQSGVKPIVEQTQLEAFSTALSILHDCEVLFVLGYNFNCDDNHINSLLHTFLHNKDTVTNQRSKKIVFFDYCQDGSKQKNTNERIIELYDQLRIPQNNRQNSISKVKFEIVSINASNSKKVLLETIKEYLNEK